MDRVTATNGPPISAVKASARLVTAAGRRAAATANSSTLLSMPR
ncbi:MAG: hypothetical protein ACR2KO_03550 [Geodermatophilaceae bacterium]